MKGFFVDTTIAFSEIFIGNRYLIGVLYDYIRYPWNLFTKTDLQLTWKIKECFEKMISRGTPFK